MNENYERRSESKEYRARIASLYSMVCAFCFFFAYEFASALCHLNIRIGFWMILFPVAGLIFACVSLFAPDSSKPQVLLRVALIVVNLYYIGIAGIAMTGIGIMNCS